MIQHIHILHRWENHQKPNLQESYLHLHLKNLLIDQAYHDNDIDRLAEHEHGSYRLQNQKFHGPMLLCSIVLDLELNCKLHHHHIFQQYQDQTLHYLKHMQLLHQGHQQPALVEKLLQEKVKKYD